MKTNFGIVIIIFPKIENDVQSYEGQERRRRSFCCRRIQDIIIECDISVIKSWSEVTDKRSNLKMCEVQR